MTTNHRQKREGNISNNHLHIEDPIINIEDVHGFVGDSLHVADNNMHNSVYIRCVICAKKFKTEEKNINTHDLKYHMKKGFSNGYSCEYCSRSCLAKINLLGHITNQHKKHDIIQNTFQSEKVLETHKRPVHNKVQLKHTIKREPSFKNHKNKK